MNNHIKIIILIKYKLNHMKEIGPKVNFLQHFKVQSCSKI